MLNFNFASWNDGNFSNDTFYTPQDGIYAFHALLNFEIFQETQIAVFFTTNGVNAGYVTEENITSNKIVRSDSYLKLQKNDAVKIYVSANNNKTAISAGYSLMGELTRLL